MMFRGGATRCRIKQSVGMIALRLVTPLTMRDENRERRAYLKEMKRYEKHLREQQQQQQQEEEDEDEDEDKEQEAAAQADAPMPGPMPGPIPDVLDGTTENGTTHDAVPPKGGPCCLKKFARHVCNVARNLSPRDIFHGRGRGRQGPTTTPMQPPRRMPHWQTQRPKPVPTWLKRGTQAASAYPVGYRPGQGRGRRRDERDQAQAAGTRVVNREDMPARYKYTNPY